jgi:hypothetical protein
MQLGITQILFDCPGNASQHPTLCPRHFLLSNRIAQYRVIVVHRKRANWRQVAQQLTCIHCVQINFLDGWSAFKTKVACCGHADNIPLPDVLKRLVCPIA